MAKVEVTRERRYTPVQIRRIREDAAHFAPDNNIVVERLCDTALQLQIELDIVRGDVDEKVKAAEARGRELERKAVVAHAEKLANVCSGDLVGSISRDVLRAFAAEVKRGEHTDGE